jgi:predicted ester cyclase
MAEEYETLMHRWFEEVWNQGREVVIDELFAEDGIGHGLPTETGEPIRGPEDFKPFYRKFREAFPNIKVTVGETVSDGEKIAAVCHVSAVHEGEGIGLSPTNQPIEFTGICMIRVKDGKIAESWNAFDFMTMYSQLGVLTLNLQ